MRKQTRARWILSFAVAAAVLAAGCGGSGSSTGAAASGSESDSGSGISTSSGGAAVEAVVAGGNTSGILTTEGELYMWGYSENGQVGNGSTREMVEEPQEILTDVKAVDISDSMDGSISGAVTEDGSLYLWGKAYGGEFTVDTADELKALKEATGSEGSVASQSRGDVMIYLGSSHPVKVMDSAVDFAANALTCAAIDEEGNLYTWGANDDSRLGRESTDVSGSGMPYSAEPKVILEHVQEVSISAYHEAAVTESGELYMWGSNEDGQIGSQAVYGEIVTSPQKVAEDVESVFCGNGFTAMVKTDGGLYTWGDASDGRLGNGSTSGQSSSPVRILENVVQIDGNSRGGLAVTEGGDLYIWGQVSTYLIPEEDIEAYAAPQKILEGVASASMGGEHLLALGTNGSVYAWGWNAYGQLKDGTTDAMEEPSEISVFD